MLCHKLQKNFHSYKIKIPNLYQEQNFLKKIYNVQFWNNTFFFKNAMDTRDHINNH